MRTGILLLGALSLAALTLVSSSADAQRRHHHRRGGAPIEWVTIRSEGGLCLDVHGPEAGRDGARVQLWPCHGGPNQLWRFERGTLVSASGGCLDVHGGDLASRGSRAGLARVHVWSCHGAANQQWSLQPNGSLVSGAGGCLDVEGGAISTQGARIIDWPCHGQANQRFRMVPAAHVQPRPPVAATPQPLDPASFDAFLARLGNAAFSSDRVAAVEGVAPHAYFTAAQIARVVGAMSFSSERVRVVELLIPRLVDPVNGGVVVESLTFSSERERAQQLLAQLPPRTYQPASW